MEKRKSCFLWLSILFISTALLSLGGCKEESANRSTLHLSMQKGESTSRSLLPKDTPLEVSRYVIEGQGPQDSTFSVMSNTSSISVEGLLIGQWNLDAIGQNEKGVDLVHGSKSITLAKEPTETVIILDALSGSGTMDVTLSWDYQMIANPSLVVQLIDSDNNATTLTPLINNISTGQAKYSALYPSGSYLLQAKLYSGSVVVAGCAEVIRIVGGKTTEGLIELSLDKYASIPTTLTLVNNVGVPVECSITGLSEAVPALVPVTTSLVALNEPDAGSLEISWYLDGELISCSNQCTFIPNSGQHRLDVIAKGPLLASSGSASITFTAIVEGTTGVPVAINRVEDTTDGVNIGMDARLAFLPDGKLVLASNQHQTIQVCRIVRDSLEVMHTYSLIDGFNASEVTDIYVDYLTYRVAIADAATPNLVIYQYDLSSSSLTKLFTRGSAYYGSETFSYLHELALDKSTGMLYGLIPDAPRVVATYFYATKQADVNPNLYAWWFKPYEIFDALAVSPSGKRAAIAETSTGLIKLCSRNDMGALFALDKDFKTPDDPYLDNIQCLRFIDDNHVLYATENDVGQFVFNSGNWTQGAVFTSEYDSLPAMEGVKQILLNNTANHAYVLAKGSKNILTFNISPSTKELSYLSSTAINSFEPRRMAISPKADHIALVSDSSTSLILFAIP